MAYFSFIYKLVAQPYCMKWLEKLTMFTGNA